MDIKAIYNNYTGMGGSDVEIRGWVRTNRASGQFGFLEVNDGTCFRSVQVVYEQKFLDNFNEISKLTAAYGVRISGTLELTPGSAQPFEIKARAVSVEAPAEGDYPLQKKRHSMEFLREIAHLRPRSNTFSAVFRVRSLAAFAVHKFFREQGFVYVNTPVITGSDAEGAGEMFTVTVLKDGRFPEDDKGRPDFRRDFFGKPASLAVSGQLEGEAYALAFKRIYTFGPTFRAEDSNTQRHAAEFWMIEPEIAFADLNDDMDIAEQMVKYVIDYVLENAPDEMEFFDRFIKKGIAENLKRVRDSEFARVSYSDAVDILKKADRAFEYPAEWGIDLQTEHERYLTDEVYKKPVFVTDYPKDIKAFYMRLNDDGRTVAAADLLVPGIGELVGGSQREERYDLLLSRMKELKMDTHEYAWYLDLRKYGGVKHSGFGAGFERLIMFITGMANIRDVIPFPRTPKSLNF